MKKEAVLIVCYTFPPDKGIGGRRWSKFAKYLSNDNYDVHVITKSKQEVFDQKEFGLEHVTIHEINSFYPLVLSKNPKTLLEKLSYKFWVILLPLIQKGSIYDRSIFMEKGLLRKMSSLIKSHNINLVFVTSAPFYLGYYAVKLKQKFKFFLTIDFRDPWTWSKGYGYSTLNEKRLVYDKGIERQVAEGADLIVSPAESILDHLINVHGIDKAKTYCVQHGVDVDLINETKESASILNTKKCIYAGTLYEGYSIFLESLIKVLKKVKLDSPELYSNFRLDIFTNSDFNEYEIEVKNEGVSDVIKFHKPLKEKELFVKMIEYDCTIVFFPEYIKNIISTKFYELIYLKVPILYVGNDGLLSDFITNNNVGTFLNIDDMKNLFLDTLISTCKFQVNTDYDVKKHLYSNISTDMMAKVSEMVKGID
jgi:glycosyltransferase involved in cell wall biosynthesis